MMAALMHRLRGLRRQRPRALPLAILVMAALLIVKSALLIQAAGGAPAALAVAARAMLSPAQAAGGHGAPSSHAPAAAKTPPAKDPVAPVAVPPAAPAEPSVNEAERAVLLDLRARRTQLEAREQAMAARDAMQAAAERRLNDRVTQLTALQARLEQLELTRRDRDDANWRGLVKTYEAMRPRDAATILNELDTPVLLQVLDRMKEAKAALVLAAMQPDRARAATTGLAEVRSRSVAAPVLATP